MAYRKRPDLWLEHLDFVARPTTLRSEAARLGIHLRTAYRWRRASLVEIYESSDVPFGEVVQLCTTTMRLNQKGVRGARSKGRRSALVTGIDTAGTAHAAVSLTPRPALEDVCELGDALQPGATVLGSQAPLSVEARLARLRGCNYLRLPRSRWTVSRHLADVWWCVADFRKWLRRFRGVRTKYLVEYFYWLGACGVADSTLPVNTSDGSWGEGRSGLGQAASAPCPPR